MGPQRRIGIYVGYESPSIIKYLEPLTGDLFTGRFADCIFDEAHFPALGGDNLKLQNECREISWNENRLNYLDPRTSQTELEVQRILHLQGLASQLSDAFTDLKRVTKSHILAENEPPYVEIPTRPTASFEPVQRQKRGRPIGAKDANPRKKKVANDNLLLLAPPEEAIPKENSLSRYKAVASCNNNPGNMERPSPTVQGNDEDLVDVDIKVAFNYVNTGDRYDRKVTVIDNIFAFAVALGIKRYSGSRAKIHT